MKGNDKFPTPPVTPVDLQTAVDALTEANNMAKHTRSRLDFADARAKRADVEAMLYQLGDYVELVAKGNEQIILSAGMNVNKTRAKHPVPSQVTSFKGIFTGIPGTVELNWKRPKFSKMFRVMMTETPEIGASWKVIETVDTRKLMVTNLASGKRFYFKVVPVNAAGIGPDSEIAEAIAA
jgi:hypothetical protein